MARAWIPRDINGCVLWVRADLGITFGTGSKVATSGDQSGNGDDITQGTGANQPTQNTNVVNGYAAITYADSSTTNLASSVAALAPTAGMTMAMVMRRTATQSIMLAGGRGDTGSNGYWIGTDQTDALKANFGNGTTNARPSKGSGSWPVNTWLIATAVYDGANGSIYKNGGTATSVALTGALTYTSVPTFYLGGITSLTATRNMTGDIAECIVLNRAASAVQLNRMHQYLGLRYGIAVT